MIPRIYIGYDPREVEAYRVCIASLRAHAEGFEVFPVNSRLLGALYTRPETKKDGVRWDVISGAPMATEFSIARFFVPLMAQTGPALYCDCDFLWRSSVHELFALFDSRYAVQVVQHPADKAGDIVSDGWIRKGTKMDGQVQTAYPRKNWSSLVLWNCGHPAHGWIKSAEYLNTRPGRDLHQFKWLTDAEIGALPLEWNWLADVSEAMTPKAVHFTLGTPDMPGYETAPYADEWRRYERIPTR